MALAQPRSEGAAQLVRRQVGDIDVEQQRPARGIRELMRDETPGRGDGSFQMNIQELGTIHNEDIDVKMIILNNQHLGMVAQWEDRFYGSCRGNTELKSNYVQRPYPDFVTIAKGYMIPGREVYEEKDLVPALKEMLETKGPFLLDIHTGYEEHVLPMIPPGKSYKNIITE